MPQAVASVLGVKEEAGRPVIDALVEVRRATGSFCSSSTTASIWCTRARNSPSASCRPVPDLKILASSREALHIAGETIYAVPALAVPDARRQDLRRSADAMRSGAAVRRARGGGATRFQADRAECAGGRRDLPPSGWHSAGDRTRGGARARAVGRSDRRAAERPLPPAGHGDRTALPRQQTCAR